MSSNMELSVNSKTALNSRTAPIAKVNVDSEDLLEIKEDITTNEPDPLFIEQSVLTGNSKFT